MQSDFSVLPPYTPATHSTKVPKDKAKDKQMQSDFSVLTPYIPLTHTTKVPKDNETNTTDLSFFVPYLINRLSIFKKAEISCKNKVFICKKELSELISTNLVELNKLCKELKINTKDQHLTVKEATRLTITCYVKDHKYLDISQATSLLIKVISISKGANKPNTTKLFEVILDLLVIDSDTDTKSKVPGDSLHAMASYLLYDNQHKLIPIITWRKWCKLLGLHHSTKNCYHSVSEALMLLSLTTYKRSFVKLKSKPKFNLNQFFVFCTQKSDKIKSLIPNLAKILSYPD